MTEEEKNEKFQEAMSILKRIQELLREATSKHELRHRGSNV